VWQVYLKFKDQEVDKKTVLQQVFSIRQSYNARVEILSPVFRPQPNRHLAPQKTQTNDMQVRHFSKHCESYFVFRITRIISRQVKMVL
jgi:hypothetical protein